MKKILVFVLISFLFNSCFLIKRGEWRSGRCRRNNENRFKLLKKDFIKTDKITFYKIYRDENLPSVGYGFYPDGRFIIIQSKSGQRLNSDDVFGVNWNTAPYRGYWRVEDDKIKIEYFVCYQSGYNSTKKGEVKGDSIVFYKNFYHPHKIDKRSYVKILDENLTFMD
ncbi:hypothetical protein [Aureivirga sp. CE67]|uniref:hypothetical protein n=1 Tax=Aureivirga sp. CE67 TaxID=1788983 RepID=UPI0018C94A5E|nr:hypothetical protein [Aureivirga sp. CE67]